MPGLIPVKNQGPEEVSIFTYSKSRKNTVIFHFKKPPQTEPFMQSFQFYFCELDSDLSFTNLAESFGSKFSNGLIQVPIDYGTGTIKRIFFEEGFNLRAGDICLNKPMSWHKVALPAARGDKEFHLSFVISPADIIERHPVVKSMQIPKSGINTFFFSNDISFEFALAAGEDFQAVDISLHGSWLREQFADAESSIAAFINQLIKNPQPSVYFECCNQVELKILDDLLGSVLTDAGNTLRSKELATSLVTGFFSKLHLRSPGEKLRQRNVYYEKMIQVEKLLKCHLQQTLPSIEAISKQVSLSESTLKRHFKQMYNKSIYEYYLELKMDLAKRILLEKEISVNEVAAMLDYGKVSNFIDMFKKHHGLSPGSMKKKLFHQAETIPVK
jgi:AraC-like DNA-binding protein